MTVEFVKELDTGTDERQACLVVKDSDYFVVSSVRSAFDTGRPETLVFAATADGDVTSYSQVAGGELIGRDEAIAMLDRGERGASAGLIGQIADALGVYDD